jgi:hypothetical protein
MYNHVMTTSLDTTANFRTGLSAIYYRKCHPNVISSFEPTIAKVFNRTRIMRYSKRCDGGPSYTKFSQMIQKLENSRIKPRVEVHGENVKVNFRICDTSNLTLICHLEG